MTFIVLGKEREPSSEDCKTLDVISCVTFSEMSGEIASDVFDEANSRVYDSSVQDRLFAAADNTGCCLETFCDVLYSFRLPPSRCFDNVFSLKSKPTLVVDVLLAFLGFKIGVADGGALC